MKFKLLCISIFSLVFFPFFALGATSKYEFSASDIQNFDQLLKDLVLPTTEFDKYLKKLSETVDSVPYEGSGETLKLDKKIDAFKSQGKSIDALKGDLIGLLNKSLDPTIPLWKQDPVKKNPVLMPKSGTLAYELMKKYSAVGYSPSNEELTELNRLLVQEEKKIIFIKQEGDVCVSYTKDATKEGENIGDGFLLGGNNHSVGGIASYSLLRYNLADKKASFNEKAAGLGIALRIYTDTQLKQANAISISQVPDACRAKAGDGLLYFKPNKGLPKIAPIVTIAPTIYFSQGSNDTKLTVQPALTFGFLNDFLSVGIGWNLAGPDAGEWFLIAGPSVGF